MLVFRILLFCLLAWIGWQLLHRINAFRQGPDTPSETSVKMVACRTCRTHVPEHEAVASGKDWFCCDAHRDAFLNESSEDRNG